MQVSICSEILKAVIDSKGAELHSVKDYNDTEYLWQANPKIWARHSPVLFPFICNTSSGTYTYNGEHYHLPNHGFARDSEFEIVFCKDNTAEFLLKASEETKKLYPFDFEIFVTYAVSENKIKTTFTVVNTDEKDIYFFIGGHPAFKCPVNPAERFEDYFVAYEQGETINQEQKSGSITNILDGNRNIPLTRELFANDVFMKDKPNSSYISLKSKATDRNITLSFDNSGCIAVWSPSLEAVGENANFVCLEPWSSVPVYCDGEEEITKMNNAIVLAPSKKYNFTFTIAIN